RLGKSSLLFRVEREARKLDYLPLVGSLIVGLQTADKSRRPEDANGLDLFNYFFDKHYSAHFAPLGIKRSVFVGRPPADSFLELVGKWTASGREVLFLWDEAEVLLYVAKNDPGFIQALRRMEVPPTFRCILAASQSLAGLFDPAADAAPSFLGRFRWLPLA